MFFALRKKQLGFTLFELIICFAALAALVGVGFGLYVLVHFITKFW